MFEAPAVQQEPAKSMEINIQDDDSIEYSVDVVPKNRSPDSNYSTGDHDSILNDSLESKTNNQIRVKIIENSANQSYLETLEANSLGVVYGRSDTGMSLSEVLKTRAFYMIWFMYAFTSIVPGVISAFYKVIASSYSFLYTFFMKFF